MKEKLFCSLAFNMHDSSVAFALGEKVVLVLEAERFFRKKKKLCTHQEMEELIMHGLKRLNKKLEEVSLFVMTTLNNPYLTRFDVIDFEKKQIREPYWKKINFLGSEREILIVNHHLSHAAIYLCTDYKSAIIISCDGGGDFNDSTNTGECLAIYTGKEDLITKHDLPLNNYLTGKIYGAVATFLYGSKYSEGKLMAFAALGETREVYFKYFEKNFKKIEVKDYRKIQRILEETFPTLRGGALSETQEAKDFAASLHDFFITKRLKDAEDIMSKIQTNENTLILAGGAGLNLDFNTRISEAYPQLKHFVAPCCDDTGQSLGALAILINQVLGIRPQVNFPYLGEGVENFDYNEKTLEEAVDFLVNDGILIIHNGKTEIGPRALGNRSFIARPDSLEVKRRLSEEIKQREAYRPVAPLVLEEKVGTYFIGPDKSPFMLYRYRVIESEAHKIIGAVHIDKSARVQTVEQGVNPFLYDLIRKFGDKTGTYVLLNTSLNLKGEPLANSLEESQEIYRKITGPKMLIYNGEIISN